MKCEANWCSGSGLMLLNNVNCQWDCGVIVFTDFIFSGDFCRSEQTTLTNKDVKQIRAKKPDKARLGISHCSRI